MASIFIEAKISFCKEHLCSVENDMDVLFYAAKFFIDIHSRVVAIYITR